MIGEESGLWRHQVSSYLCPFAAHLGGLEGSGPSVCKARPALSVSFKLFDENLLHRLITFCRGLTFRDGSSDRRQLCTPAGGVMTGVAFAGLNNSPTSPHPSRDVDLQICRFQPKI